MIKFYIYLKIKLNKDDDVSIDIDIELVKKLENFRKKKLNFDDDSDKWLTALTLVSFWDGSGFDFIARQLDIPNTKANIYKGLISSEIETISSLFDELSREIPYDLQVILLKILKGDVDSLRDLILRK